VSFAAAREARFDQLATAMEAHLDLTALERLIGQARPIIPAVGASGAGPAAAAVLREFGP
jgi:hypothetical protein